MSSAVPSSPACSVPSALASLLVAVAAVGAAAVLALVLAGPVRAETASRTDTPTDLRFGEFFRLPIGARGLELSDALKAADGREVRLVGYIVAREQGVPGRFFLTARPVRMSEHADGEADDLPAATVTVLLDPAQHDRIVQHTQGPVALTGRLQVGRAEGEDGRVSWVRLQLAPDAVAVSAAAPVAPAHTH